MRAMTFSSPLPAETLLVHPHGSIALEEEEIAFLRLNSVQTLHRQFHGLWVMPSWS